MKALFLLTGSSEVLKYAQGLENLKFGEVVHMRYDEPGRSEQMLYDRVRDAKPDMIVYVGSRWGLIPSIATLAQINSKVAPMVHFCSDAADYPWHDLLREYHDKGCFSLQVNIDGSNKWPGASSGLTMLTPVDPLHFPSPLPPHSARPVVCGFAGNTGGGPNSRRTIILTELLEKRAIDMRVRSPLPFTYEGYCEYLTRCRISLNIAYSGSEQTMQVKGRVIEAAIAGSCVLETKGSPTSEWFEPGRDYLEYESAEEAVDIIGRMPVEATQRIADNLRAKIMEKHSPRMFWSTALNRIGVKP